MQNRMRTHSLNKTQIEQRLDIEHVGRISTTGKDGYPYTVPVHFVVIDDKIYIHGLVAGQKLDNIKRDPRVCFEVDYLDSIIYDEPDTACNVNAKYESVIIQGVAALRDDISEKKAILDRFMQKYAPELADLPMPEAELKGTGIIEISVERITGKFYG